MIYYLSDQSCNFSTIIVIGKAYNCCNNQYTKNVIQNSIASVYSPFLIFPYAITNAMMIDIASNTPRTNKVKDVPACTVSFTSLINPIWSDLNHIIKLIVKSVSRWFSLIKCKHGLTSMNLFFRENLLLIVKNHYCATANVPPPHVTEPVIRCCVI